MPGNEAWEVVQGSGVAGHRPVATQRATRCPWLRPGALLASAPPTLRQADYLWWMPPWGREPFESKDSLWGQELECRRPALRSWQAPRPPQGGRVGPPRKGVAHEQVQVEVLERLVDDVSEAQTTSSESSGRTTSRDCLLADLPSSDSSAFGTKAR